LLLRVTGKALVGGGPETVTVQVAVPGAVKEEGEQDSPLKAVTLVTVILAPTPDAGMTAPSAATATVPDTAIGMDAALPVGTVMVISAI
jgi:hypothetical protein